MTIRRIAIALCLVAGACGSGTGVASPDLEAAVTDCDSQADPMLLSDALLRFQGTWWRTTTSAMTSADATSDARDNVVLPSLDSMATPVPGLGNTASDKVGSQQLVFAPKQFAGVQVADSFGGGDLLLKVQHSAPTGHAFVSVAAYVDPAGRVLFLGGCAPVAWTAPFRAFALDVAWTDTEEELLLEIVEGDRWASHLTAFEAGVEFVAWVDRPPRERSLLDADASGEVLRDLDASFLTVSIPHGWLSANANLCPFVPDVGWMGCLPLREGADVEKDRILDVWVRAEEPVELWLRSRDKSSEDVLLGTVVYGAAQVKYGLLVGLADPAPAVLSGGLRQVELGVDTSTWFEVQPADEWH